MPLTPFASARWYDGIPGDSDTTRSAPIRRRTHRSQVFVRGFQPIPARRANQQMLFQPLATVADFYYDHNDEGR